MPSNIQLGQCTIRASTHRIWVNSMPPFLIAPMVLVACLGTFGSTALADPPGYHITAGQSWAEAIFYVLTKAQKYALERRNDRLLEAQSPQITEQLNSGNNVVVYETREYRDLNGGLFLSEPMYVGAGDTPNAVIAQAYSQPRMYQYAKGYKHAQSYFYYYTKTSNGAIGRSGKKYHNGTPGQQPDVIIPPQIRWPLADDLVRAAREQMAERAREEQVAERAREQARARAQKVPPPSTQKAPLFPKGIPHIPPVVVVPPLGPVVPIAPSNGPPSDKPIPGEGTTAARDERSSGRGSRGGPPDDDEFRVYPSKPTQ